MEYAVRMLTELGIQDTSELTVQLVGRLVASRPASNSRNTTRGLCRYVQALCGYAETMGYVRISPFRLRKLSSFIRPQPPQGKRHASIEECHKVLQLMQERAQQTGWAGWKAKRTYTLTAVLLYTGMRAGEAYWLRIEDIDLEQQIIWIRSTPAHTTKTAKAEAPIPIPPKLRPILEAWMRLHRMAAPASWKLEECPWVFPTTRRSAKAPWISGGPGGKPRHAIQATAAEPVAIEFTPLSCRHSFITHFLTAFGGTAALAKRIARHTNEHTAHFYTHDDIPNLLKAVEDVEF